MRYFWTGLKTILILAIVIDLVFLNYEWYRSLTSEKASISPAETTSVTNTCATCSAEIQRAFSMITAIQTTLSQTPTPAISFKSSSQTTGPGSVRTKEYFISLGSAIGNYTTWTTISGMQAAIDTSAYSNIKSVTFEVSGTVATGNQIVWVQLYDQTQQHLVWNSTVSWNGGGSQFVSSPSISLDAGNNTYVVQMQTQLGYFASIDQARVHIILN